MTGDPRGDAGAVASRVCRLLEPVLGCSLEVLVARVNLVSRWWVATVGVTRRQSREVSVGAAAMMHRDGAAAVAHATIAAATDADLLGAVARRLVEVGAVDSGVVVERGATRVFGGGPQDAIRLAALCNAMPRDGWLTVDTDRSQHRALHLGPDGLAFSVADVPREDMDCLAADLNAVLASVPPSSDLVLLRR